MWQGLYFAGYARLSQGGVRIKKVGEGLGWSFAYRRGENSMFSGVEFNLNEEAPLIPSAPSFKLSEVSFVFKKFLPILPIFRNCHEILLYEGSKN